jgi:hypothetical protein
VQPNLRTTDLDKCFSDFYCTRFSWDLLKYRTWQSRWGAGLLRAASLTSRQCAVTLERQVRGTQGGLRGTMPGRSVAAAAHVNLRRRSYN